MADMIKMDYALMDEMAAAFNQASNILFDGGVIYKTGFSSLRIAATIQNFGTNSKFINEIKSIIVK